MNTVVDFGGHAVLVTGGTRGIGAEIARSFLAAGADVVVCGRTAPTSPPSAAGRTARFLAADIREADAAAELVERAAALMGGLGVLVNNAGGSPDAEAATVSPRFVERVVQLNLLAPFYVAQPANRIMQDRPGGGVIVNVGSVSGSDPQPGTAAYTAAKAGLLALTRALALEWAPKVRVNHITAGPVRTEDSAGRHGQDGSAAGRYGQDGGAAVDGLIPMGRMAEPRDVADACLYLASDLASYVTGADLAVHGGGEVPARYVVTRD
jgi:NAD(P)-dependent dehydrogenase (short-subunit alcohol dehydrogenase family)